MLVNTKNIIYGTRCYREYVFFHVQFSCVRNVFCRRCTARYVHVQQIYIEMEYADNNIRYAVFAYHIVSRYANKKRIYTEKGDHPEYFDRV